MASPSPSAPSPLALSVVIVAKNEAGNLPRCLASVSGWADDVVVALNDTTDDSERVVRAAGARVEHVPWLGYRDTKNAALSLAKHTWVLAIDADEEVSSDLRIAIHEFFRDHSAFSGALFPRKVWYINRWITHGEWYPDFSLRLFRRDRSRWGGDAIVHEKIVCEGRVAKLSGDLHHYSFPTLESHIAKLNMFADLFMQQQRSTGGRFSLVAAVVRPGWRFFRGYILRSGWMDGFPGFIIAWTASFGSFVRYSRLYEKESKRTPPPVVSSHGR